MKGLLIALQFMTRVPTPSPGPVSVSDFATSMRWFPATGLVVGLSVAAAGWIGAWIDPWLGALAGLAAWVAVTGALHLDGLADLADASGAAHRDRERFLAVLADPHIGSFGVVALVLQLATKLVLLRLAIRGELWAALILLPIAARAGILVWQCFLPGLGTGLGMRFADAVRPRDIGAWGILLGIACFATPSLLLAPMLIALWWFWLKRRVGGVTGDCHGAGIELVETGLLLAAVAFARIS